PGNAAQARRVRALLDARLVLLTCPELPAALAIAFLEALNDATVRCVRPLVPMVDHDRRLLGQRELKGTAPSTNRVSKRHAAVLGDRLPCVLRAEMLRHLRRDGGFVDAHVDLTHVGSSGRQRRQHAGRSPPRRGYVRVVAAEHLKQAADGEVFAGVAGIDGEQDRHDGDSSSPREASRSAAFTSASSHASAHHPYLAGSFAKRTGVSLRTRFAPSVTTGPAASTRKPGRA